MKKIHIEDPFIKLNLLALSGLSTDGDRLLYNGRPIANVDNTSNIGRVRIHRIGDPDDPLSEDYDRKTGDFLYVVPGDNPDILDEPSWTAGGIYICSGIRWNLIVQHQWLENRPDIPLDWVYTSLISTFQNDAGYALSDDVTDEIIEYVLGAFGSLDSRVDDRVDSAINDFLEALRDGINSIYEGEQHE